MDEGATILESFTSEDKLLVGGIPSLNLRLDVIGGVASSSLFRKENGRFKKLGTDRLEF